jgi:electron transfer flavoprotein alpha subunit
MAVLLIAEMNGAALAADSTAKALSAAKAMGSPVDVLVAGADCRSAAETAAQLAGADRVLLADDPSLSHGVAEPLAALVVSLAGSYSHIAAAATVAGKNVAPRIAALLDVMVITDISGVVAPDVFVRPIYAGNAFAEVESADPIKVVTVRTATFEAAGSQATAPIEAVAVPSATAPTTWISEAVAASDRPELTAAKVVVSGGRALGSAENFKIIERVADKLGAAIGASRAAVDSGYAPNDWQVGQTGKVVAPDLYIAVGISGAIQHLAGMKDSKVIVAINKDEEAPIFQVADYGLVADLFDAVPELEKKLG